VFITLVHLALNRADKRSGDEEMKYETPTKEEAGYAELMEEEGME